MGDLPVDKDDDGDRDHDHDHDYDCGHGHDGDDDHVLPPDGIRQYRKWCKAYNLRHYCQGQIRLYLPHGDGDFPAADPPLLQSLELLSDICTSNNSYCWTRLGFHAPFQQRSQSLDHDR